MKNEIDLFQTVSIVAKFATVQIKVVGAFFAPTIQSVAIKEKLI